MAAAKGPKTRDSPQIPRAMGRRPATVVMVVRSTGRKRRSPEIRTASLAGAPRARSLLVKSIKTRELLTTTPAGVVVNNSLVLIDFTNKERARGAPAKEAVLISGERRFRPVLLTTITTVAGLLPMALGIWGESLVFGPFAAAIVAGLSVSSLLTLFVVPSLYVSLDALRARLSGSERRTSPAGAQAGAGLK